MTTPLYNSYQDFKDKPLHCHTGLWFERFFKGFEKENDWAIPKPKEGKDIKRDWINQVSGLLHSPQLESFHQRQQNLITALKGKSQCYKTDWHFISGMGNPHPVENGFSWHPTLAVPYLAGSAVKGLVRAWLETELNELCQEDENEDNLDKQKQIKARLEKWFGTADKQDVAEQTGGFIFFDAIPETPPTLMCDIMTPHMGKWYEAGGDAGNLNPDVIPADWHEPVPVPFLAVKNAQFIFSIAARKADYQSELTAVFKALESALDWLGVGGKTAAGYGYMTQDTDFENRLQRQIDEFKRLEAEKKRLESLSPFDREIEILLNEHSSRVPQDYLLDELRKGRWKDTEQQAMVAEKIKAYLESLKVWFPVMPTSKKNLKKHRRTLEVMGYLK